jgi:biopolymer transport protein TolQ
LAYNKLKTDLARFAARLEGFATEFGAILSRQTEVAANDGGPRSPNQAAE